MDSRRFVRGLTGSAAAFAAAALGVAFLLGSTPARAHGETQEGATATVPDNGRITVTGTEFRFEPSAIRVEQGQRVTIVFRNEGALSHNLTIPSLHVHTDTIQSGATDTIRFTASTTGTYRFWCTVPGHKQAGMQGRVRVVK